jgi:hypothetical protein
MLSYTMEPGSGDALSALAQNVEKSGMLNEIEENEKSVD